MDEWADLAAEAWEDFGPLAAVAVAGVVLIAVVGMWLAGERR